jgi:phosphohistidine phosphatase
MAHLTQENFIRLEPGMFAEISLSIVNWDMLGFGTGTLEEIVS